MEKTIYFGCSLTHATVEFRAMIEEFKQALRDELGVGVLDFFSAKDLSLSQGTAEQVYEYDIHECVHGCSVMIAECSMPSIGLGWELATAVEKLCLPTLAIADEKTKVTRLVIGASHSERNPHFTFMTYNDIRDTIPKIQEMLVRITC